MSFILNSKSKDSIRRGIIKFNNLQYETPLIFQYTRNGSVPHLDWNLCQRYLEDNSAPLLIPLPTCIGMTTYSRSLNVDIRKFCCIPDSRATFISVNDPLKPSPSGHNYKAGISVWTSSGRTQVSSDDYIEIISLLKPDAFQSLCDSDTPEDASRKRIDQSVKRTIGYLDQISNQRDDESSPPLFGSIEGGSDLNYRLISVKATTERPVCGFIFESLPQIQLADNEKQCDLTKAVVSQIPEEKPRVLFGSLRPEDIHSMIRIGFDVFDSSYATSLAEDGKALLVDLIDSTITKSSTLDLNDGSKYKEDFSIISQDCGCYSCRKGFTKAYLNHLLNCKEMTSTVLLMFHNLHVLYDWMNKLKCSQ